MHSTRTLFDQLTFRKTQNAHKTHIPQKAHKTQNAQNAQNPHVGFLLAFPISKLQLQLQSS
jgi:hypothetical protein